MKLRTCRICLAIGVKMAIIGNPAVATFMENIFKSKGFNESLNERHYCCFECKALLNKSWKFIQKSLRAQKAMYDIIKTHKQVVITELYKLNRENLGLNSTLSYHKVDTDLYVQNDDDEVQTIKKEVEVTFSDLEPDNENIKCEDGIEMNDGFDMSYDETNDIPDKRVNKKPKEEEESDSSFSLDQLIPERKKKSKIRKKKKTNVQTNSSPQQTVRRIRPKRSKSPDVNVKNIIEGGKRSRKTAFNNIEVDSDSSKSDSGKSQPKKTDVEYDPTMSMSSSDESVSSHDSYDNQGKLTQKPRDSRVYPMQCDHCDIEIEEKRNHYIHYLTYHRDVEYPYGRPAVFVCDICGKRYRSNIRLQEHIQTHKTVRDVPCPLCDMKFKNRTGMLSHKRSIHTAPLIYCDYCNKSSKTRSDLILHIRIHTGQKPFKCHICGAAYAHKGNVGVHIRSVHQNDTSVKQKTVGRKKKKQKKRDTEEDTPEEENSKEETPGEIDTGEESLEKRDAGEKNRRKKVKRQKRNAGKKWCRRKETLEKNNEEVTPAKIDTTEETAEKRDTAEETPEKIDTAEESAEKRDIAVETPEKIDTAEETPEKIDAGEETW